MADFDRRKHLCIFCNHCGLDFIPQGEAKMARTFIITDVTCYKCGNRRGSNFCFVKTEAELAELKKAFTENNSKNLA